MQRLPQSGPPARRLALFCTNFLPTSQVFVYEQLRHYQRYQAHIFCWRRFNRERFCHGRVVQAGPAYVVRGRSRRFERAFARTPFDVAHAHFGPAGAYAARYAQAYGVPLVVTFHGYDVPLLSSWRRFLPVHLPYARGRRALFEQLRLGICASEELRQLLERLGVSPERLVVHRLGVDLERFAFRGERDEALVAMVGRLVEKKGFEYGLRAFAHATGAERPRLRAASLVIVGDGPLRASLERQCRELGIGQRVSFVGEQSHAEVASLLGRASVLLAPSVVARDGNRESGLIVVKEAAAVGTVPVATRHGGIPDSIDDGQTGYLVAERDWLGMGERLGRLLESEPLRLELARAGRRKMEREFDNRKLVAGLEALYDGVVESGGRGG